MRKYLSPFTLLFTLIIGIAYAYARYQLSPNFLVDGLLFLPFLSIWLTPILFWIGEQQDKGRLAHFIQISAYISMGWLNFIFMTLIPLNLLVIGLESFAQEEMAKNIDLWTMPLTYTIASLALIVGYLRARSGPSLSRVSISHSSLSSTPELNGLRIVQISDLHVGPTIHKPYVEKVVRKINEIQADIVVLTGDIVDGSVNDLSPHVAPLSQLKAKFGSFFIMGNHDYYSGASSWIPEFQKLGMTVLLNEHKVIHIGKSSLLLAGVIDPAAAAFNQNESPDPDKARGNKIDSESMFRLLLAHNPKIAPKAKQAGFHLQLSGHTHAGQFVPWTWVTKLVHKPHYVGLSEEGDMKVYVSAGTGSWGPPIRLGTSPEITLITLTH